MKVLILNSSYYPNILGGAEISVQILAETLVNIGIDVVVLTTAKVNKITYINNVKVYYIKVPNLYWVGESKKQRKFKKFFWHILNVVNPFLKNKLFEIFRIEKPDIVHTNNLGGFSVYPWKFFKIYNVPIIHTLRDYSLLCISATMFRNNNVCNKQCFICKNFSYLKKIFSNKYVDAVVGISNFVLEKHLKLGYFSNSIVKKVIYNPIGINKRSTPVFVKEKYKDIITFGFVGTLSKHKGIDRLLYLFNKLPQNLNVKLYVYGKGETKDYEDFLKRKYTSRRIIFKGFAKREEIYQEIDVLIVPSLWNEAFGRIVIEANYFNIPVIVSNRGGLKELVKDHKNGFIFNIDNDNDFFHIINKTIECLKKNKFNFDNVKKFEDTFVAEQYKSAYNKLVEIYKNYGKVS